MSQLMAFEAAARHGSFTAAARELSITQSAISHQIRQLEEQLAQQLFIRDKRNVWLTEAGTAYAREIGEALHRIGNASLNLKTNPDGGTLNLAILPTFGTRWLAPRLPRFLDGHPGITLNLSTRLSPFSFEGDPLDAAIHFGERPWKGTEGVQLMTETVLPVCSPDFLAEAGLHAPSDLAGVPLLRLESRPHQWDLWLAAQGVAIAETRGMRFDQFATLAQAAMAGLGVALLPHFLIENDLERGDLVRAFDAPMESRERYYLVWPKGREGFRPLAQFRDWIVAEADHQ